MSTTRAGLVLRHVRGLAQPAEDDRLLVERFSLCRDEPAFAELVRRHGPMVLGVCRRVLRDPHAAEDAFQATFLVLARKASSISKGESVGGWLYRVAYHTAVRARKQAAVRRGREGFAPGRPVADALDEVTGRELMAVLDEELARLPPRYRTPLVLCYLEGKTRDEAAQQLRCPLGTLKRRLEEARNCLRTRLERRGLGLPSVLLAVGPAAVAVPESLAASATESALLVASGNAEAVPPQITRLMPATLSLPGKSMVLLLAATLLGVGLLARGMLPVEPPESAAKEPARPQAPEKPPATDAKTVAITGRVLTPEGKAASGAHVAAIVYRPRIVAAEEPKVAGTARADGEGRYRLELPALPADEPYFVHLRAAAKGYGMGGQIVDSRDKAPDTSIQLVAEHPARAGLINIEGAAAARVKLRVRVPGHGDIPEGEPWPGPVTTDDRGRFTLRGLGKGWQVVLEVEDDRFVRQRLSLEVGAGRSEEGPTFTLAPLRVLEGTVTAEDTHKPIPNARVVVEAHANQGNTSERVEVRTDGQGRYRAIPYEGNALVVHVFAPDGVPCVPRTTELRWAGAAVKQVVDVKLPTGVLVRGKVTEAGTGKPVVGATVGFRPRRRGNPAYRNDAVGYGGSLGLLAQLNTAKTGADGAFRLAVLPGPGHLLVKGPTPDYLHTATSYHEMESGKPGGERYYPDALIALDPKPGAEPAELAISLRRGVTLKGRVVRPDGKPAGDCAVLCRSYLPWGVVFHHNLVPVQDGAFELPGCDPEKPTQILALDAAGQLGAVAEVSSKEAKDGPVTIRLAPCGSATVRFVDDKGKPWVNQPVGPWPLFVHLHVALTPGKVVWADPSREGLQSDTLMMVNLDPQRYGALRTDAEGRVTFPTLIPGATIGLMTGEDLGTVRKEFTVKPGEKVELPDVVMKRRAE